MLRAIVIASALVQVAPTPSVTLPSQPLRFGAFARASIRTARSRLDGQGWPSWAARGKLPGPRSSC